MNATETLYEDNIKRKLNLGNEIPNIYKNSNRLLRLINQLLDFRKKNIISTSTKLVNHQLFINSNKEVLEQLIKEVTAKYLVQKLDF
jgi:hypothetical protein